MAESLRVEIERLGLEGERSQYLETLTHSTILTEDDWARFKELFEKVHPEYIADQKALHPELTRAEMRLIALEKLGLEAQEMANMLGISINSVSKIRQRMHKK